ncbi:undecaprenyldiphospho-muramoylpentapeptide beta-N-acetylglucosaminyltransferase [Rhodohalobacter sp. SW132]|uniref:undecaprenyldiphospho-muramoylpentapeptide beta-N-acetylglucosaminyltransferase n=1 Tax=Rhodohalobacter sp. SW132 TaxID=2293433 RepID=UPI000E243467|nr:undecaprenyldiphospho-muramoylpentapeptide beta-N-acetylglucosaminyltransferase [Rhodohalobacter sp. SW132]REL24262.1 undecaprenyldiphospho-muramoylpentapeptide beta-N-acetylglucosaminyltransferase [Rhodohalobacter sp. SW132]
MNALKQKPSAKKAAKNRAPIRVLLAAGGTGGHVYPAISIADAVRAIHPDSEILFVGTRDRMEWQAVPGAGYDIKSVWISGFHRRLTPQNLLFPLKLIVSLIQSRSILKNFKPDVLVSCGGFASGPVGWVAAKMGIPVVIQEQNSFPGVTNRMLAKHAQRIFTAFEAADQFLPAEKITLTGNPVRSRISVQNRDEALDHFDFSSDKPVLLVLGGSGGALAINNAMEEAIVDLHHEHNIQVIWQCGKKYYDELSARINTSDFPNLRLLGYINNMPAAYGAADLVLTRAGAGTCSELMLIGKPSILVPSPNVAGDHQTKNAASMVENGASVLVTEPELDELITVRIHELIKDQQKLEKMSHAAAKLAKPNAAHEIADTLFEIAEQRNG